MVLTKCSASRALVAALAPRQVRALMLALFWPILSRGAYEFDWRHGAATVYGGLRGAVGLTLGLIVHETFAGHAERQAKILGDGPLPCACCI